MMLPGLMFPTCPIAAPTSRLRNKSSWVQSPGPIPTSNPLHIECWSVLSSQDLYSIPSIGPTELSSGFSGNKRQDPSLMCQNLGEKMENK